MFEGGVEISLPIFEVVMKFKNGVKFDGVKPAIWYAIGFIDCASIKESGREAVITSLVDFTSERLETTLHDDGEAADIRVREYTPEEERKILSFLQIYLDPHGFDTMIHGKVRHIHSEYQPKGDEKLFKWVD